MKKIRLFSAILPICALFVAALCGCAGSSSGSDVPSADDSTTSSGGGMSASNLPQTKTYNLKIMSFNLDQAYGNDAAKQTKV